MNKIVNFINDTQMDAMTEKIISGQLSNNIIYEKVVQFNALPVDLKQIYLFKLAQRLSKIKKPHKLLSVLLLLDSLSKCNPRLSFPNVFVNKVENDGKKESIALLSIITYYHYFQKCNIANRFNIETANPEDELEQVLHFS